MNQVKDASERGRFSMWTFIAALVFIVIVAQLAGCADFQHRQWREQQQTPEEDRNVTLRFVEFDDEGWLWQPQQAMDAIDLIERSAAHQNTVVVTFIHGWHHTTRCCDTNLEAFKETLARIQRRISSEDHRAFVEKGMRQSVPTTKIIGIYVGWRGRSLPGLLDYTTFWGRKSAAERVGETDFREFLQRLRKVYLKYHPEKTANRGQSQQSAPRHFLGMVTIGHSFGGQVLLRAVASSIESQLITLSDTNGYLRDSQPTQPTKVVEKLDGIGDLIILVNPAAEASQYQRLHVLAQSLEYRDTQTPVILTVSSKTDYPRHRLFAFGRVLGESFTGKPRKSDPVERQVERQALGVYPGHVTHELVPYGQTLDSDDPEHRLVKKPLQRNAGPSCNDVLCKLEWLAWKDGASNGAHDSLNTGDSDDLVRRYDFSRATFSNVTLQPKKGAAAIPYQPLIVAEASDSIIEGHNGIFTDPFINFLVPYVTFLESKIIFNLPLDTDRKLDQERAEKMTATQAAPDARGLDAVP